MCNNTLAGVLSWQKLNSNSSFYTDVASYQNFLRMIIATEDVESKIYAGEPVKNFTVFAYQVGKYFNSYTVMNVMIYKFKKKILGICANRK